MNGTERPPAPAGGRAFLGAALIMAVVAPAWAFCGLALLALSTFLPPWPSFAVLAGVLIGAGALSFLFCRVTAVRESLEALRGGRGGIQRLGGALLTLAALSLLVVFGTRAVWRASVDALKRDLRSKGLPVTLAGFREDLPDGRYAYAAVSKAVEKDFNREFYDGIYHTGDSIGRWTPETFRKEAPTAGHYAPYLDKTLTPLLARGYDRYMKVDYEAAAKEPASMPTPQLGNFLPIARAAKINAVSRAFKGDAARAWPMVRLQFSMAGMLSGEKSAYSKIIALGLRRLAVETALDIMLNAPGAELPADLAGRLADVMGTSLAADEMKCELAYQFDEYAFLSGLGAGHFMSGGGLFPGPLPGAEGRAGLRLRLQYGAFSVMRMTGMLDINALMTARFLSSLAAVRTWPQAAQENERVAAAIRSLPSWPYLLVKLSLPEFSRMFEREYELKAWAQVTLAYSGLGRACRTKGRCPKDISELSPRAFPAEALRDVFNGGKLLYSPAKDGKGFELCSPGPAGDKKDAFGRDFCVRK